MPFPGCGRCGPPAFDFNRLDPVDCRITMLDRSTDARGRILGDRPTEDACPEGEGFVPFEDAWIERPIVERFAAVASRHSDKVAVADETTRLTYGELRRAAFHLARRIDTLVPAGRPVGVLLPNNALFPVAALGCLAAGRPYVPIDPNSPALRIDHIRREAGLSAMILDRVAGEVFYDAGALPCLDIGTSLGIDEEQTPPDAATDGPAFILYTSGSTGRPKG